MRKQTTNNSWLTIFSLLSVFVLVYSPNLLANKFHKRLENNVDYFIPPNIDWAALVPTASRSHNITKIEAQVAQEQETATGQGNTPICEKGESKETPVETDLMAQFDRLRAEVEEKERQAEAEIQGELVSEPTLPRDPRWSPEALGIVCDDKGDYQHFEPSDYKHFEDSIEVNEENEKTMAWKMTHGSSVVRFGYNICKESTSITHCSHNAFGHYVKKELQENSCQSQDQSLRAQISPALLVELEKMKDGKQCHGEICELYRQVIQRVKQFVDESDEILPESQMRKAVFFALFSKKYSSGSQFSDVILDYIYASTLAVLSQKKPGMIFAEAPHLVKAASSSCVIHRNTSYIHQEVKWSGSGSVGLLYDNRFEYQHGIRNEALEAKNVGGVSCPIVAGKPQCH